ncbi:MAG: peptidase [Planctomycetaceae bacterium]|nr:peptidase [Planctomycetaceae bacterium]
MSSIIVEPEAPATSRQLPERRDDLVVRPVGDDQFVVKDPVTETYFQLGEQEWFLLSQFNATATSTQVLDAFQRRFNDALTSEDLDEFVEMASKRHLLKQSSSSRPRSKIYTDSEDESWNDAESLSSSNANKKSGQSLLFWRYSLFDPDRLFNRVEPLLRWIWSVEFFIISCLFITAAGIELWVHRAAFYAAFPGALRWETLAAVWLTLILATICHEFAHGLTCKHFGGEVHEVGFLLMFFTPCLYCNVSDAWLIPSKWRRLWITLAGAWCDLCVWAVATFIWRLTVPEVFVNYLSSVVLSVCGARVLLNFNPLLKLDGYYLLSDWLEIPNLRGRSWERWLGWARHVLWGAPRPPPAKRDLAITLYGMISWSFSLAFLTLVFANVAGLARSRGGWIGGVLTIFLGTLTIKRLLRGLNGGEIRKMITTRISRTTIWLAILGLAPVFMSVVQMEESAGGTFHVRTGKRLEIRAEVSGFVKEIHFDEGDQVSAGALVARIEVPDLQSQIAQKSAAVQEAQANLRRLKIGPRPEEVAELKAKVTRGRNWRDLAASDLTRAKQGFKEELSRLELQVSQNLSELAYTRQSLVQSERLYKKGVLAGEQFRSEKRKVQVAEAVWQQAITQKRTREASGTILFEAELAKREKELADTIAALALLQAGAHPEEIKAEGARLSKFQEELAYFQDMSSKQELRCALSGLVTTPRLKEKIGQFLEKGTIICTIEDLRTLEAEIAIPEDKMDGIHIGQTIDLKARAFPMKTFPARVDRIAPIANVALTPTSSDHQGTITIYCEVDNPQAELRSGMSGFGRVYRGKKSLATMAGMGFLRYFRTEFWW